MQRHMLNYSETGLLAGLLVSAIMGVALFWLTAHIMYLAVIGAGTVVGLYIGLVLDTMHQSRAS